MRTKISKRTVDGLRPGESAVDTEIRGFIARRLPSGTVTYGYRYRNITGHQRWLPLGLHGQITPDQARDLAKKRAGEVADDRDPSAERAAQRATAANTVDAILDSFLDRYVQKQQLRSADEIERTFRVYVRPRLGNRSIYDLKRRDIVELLDTIEDKNGPVMADRVLAYVRKAFNWQATRDDSFSPPIVRGMSRSKPKERARTRILSDQEIRNLWMALDALNDDAPICYAPFVRTLLLTGQRRENVATMRWEEISGDAWLIPSTKFKTKIEQSVPLTESVKMLLGPKQKSGFVFSSDGGKRAFAGFSKSKRTLDRKLIELRKQKGWPAMLHWVHHDLRRTSRSLMSRAGVPSDMAERVLGHAIPGVRGVYDRHSYFQEKLEALQQLAVLLDGILHPIDAVVPFLKSRPRQQAHGLA